MKLLKKFNQSRIASYIGADRQNLYTSKQNNPKAYEVFEFGVYVYLHNISIDQLELIIYRAGIKKSQIKVREILGYKRNIQLSKRNINVSKVNEHLRDIKFRTKYFKILGAIAILAGITKDNIKEYSTSTEHREAPTFENNLPALTGWKGLE